MNMSESIDRVLATTEPLRLERGQRLPLFVWTVRDPEPGEQAADERRISELAARGMAVITSWDPSPDRREQSLAAGLRTAAIQRRLGAEVVVNANSCMHDFFDGSEATAHVEANGQRFFDNSFHPQRQMGCPFAIDHRYPAIRAQIEYFLKAYKAHGVGIDMLFLDWEIDGPLEWNGAWASSKRCRRCREAVPNLDDFGAFQEALRQKRAEIQHRVFVDVVHSAFPSSKTGNYSVYPHDGRRYWYDFFENLPEGAPYEQDRKARYRMWYDEFSRTGYDLAMPVVYPWARLYHWYDFAQTDYRWFYNMLKIASNAGRSARPEVPVISFVHWQPIWEPLEPDASVQPMSEWAYTELLWHMLLRGTDALFLWCPLPQTQTELAPVYRVFAESLAYNEFLLSGRPVCFDVPAEPGTVISGLRLGDRCLVRRTDFDGDCGGQLGAGSAGGPRPHAAGATGDAREPVRRPVRVPVQGATLSVPRRPGECQVLQIN